MRKNLLATLAVSLATILSLGFFVGHAYADGEENNGGQTEIIGTSLRLSPANFVVQLSSDNTLEKTFEVRNEGNEDVKVEIFASPYSYSYSEEDDTYKLGFSQENNYTQITRWITFKDADGRFVQKPKYTIKAGESIQIDYHITTPPNIPAGGQYAVLFVHALGEATSEDTVRAEASPGMVIYGRSTEGESIIKADITNIKLDRGITESGVTRNNVYGSAKVKNNGNVDFSAIGKLKVEPIIGFSSYETPNGGAQVSIIPEVELSVTDEWKETPDFGIYKATWTVTAGDQEQTIEQIYFLFSPISIILIIIVLTLLIIWIILLIRKRKERRSRLAI